MFASGKEVSCRNCNGGCCRDIGIQLNSKEVEFMEKSGSVLHPLLEAGLDKDWAKANLPPVSSDPNVKSAFVRAGRLEKGDGIYLLIGACGNLIEKDGWLQCHVYSSPERPKACKDFKRKSTDCKTLFKKAWAKVELTKKPTA